MLFQVPIIFYSMGSNQCDIVNAQKHHLFGFTHFQNKNIKKWVICVLLPNITRDMNRYCLFLIALLVVETSFAHTGLSFKNIGAFCKDDTPQGDPNMLPIESGPPRLIRTVENGTLYEVGVGEDQSWLVHVWGMNGYDYGFAYGTLLSEQINQFLPNVYVYLEKEILDNLDNLKLPTWFKELVVDEGLGIALDLQNALVHSYMDEEIYNELRGIADAAKIDYKLLVRLHMFGELTRGNIKGQSLVFVSLICIQVIVHIMVFRVRQHLVVRLFNYAHLIGIWMLIYKNFQSSLFIILVHQN
jgi:hypothetical protein